VNAYAAGLNLYVQQHREELPPWIPVFSGVDVMASRRAGAIRATYSQTTRSSSKHSSDQIRLFADHQLRPIWFGEAEIKAHLESEYHPGSSIR
jgi:acyl-homoserine lactone acylase PvdQ